MESLQKARNTFDLFTYELSVNLPKLNAAQQDHVQQQIQTFLEHKEENPDRTLRYYRIVLERCSHFWEEQKADNLLGNLRILKQELSMLRGNPDAIESSELLALMRHIQLELRDCIEGGKQSLPKASK